MKRNRKRSGQAGVTLIEMLVVVTIIGLFVALVGPSLFKRADIAKVDRRNLGARRFELEEFLTAPCERSHRYSGRQELADDHSTQLTRRAGDKHT